MNFGEHLDINEPVKYFISSFQGLSRLPLITDAEMDRLFGSETAAALGKMNRFGDEQGICRGCLSRCCLLVRCELYDPRLSRCPIHSYRPILCRMHFCDRYARVFGIMVKEIGDLFLESLLEAEHLDCRRARLLDSPPLGEHDSRLVDIVRPIVASICDDRMEESSGLMLIQNEVEKYYEEKAEG